MKWSEEDKNEFLDKFETILNEMCHEKGRDFTFKNHQIAEKVGKSAYTCAKFIPELEERGIIIRKRKARRVYVYQTCIYSCDENNNCDIECVELK